MPTSRAIPKSRPVTRALEELRFFTAKLVIMGVYPAHPFREDMPVKRVRRFRTFELGSCAQVQGGASS